MASKKKDEHEIESDEDDANAAFPFEFTFTGAEGEKIPYLVSSIRVAPGVTSIPRGTFDMSEGLRIVSLPEGLVEIGDNAFQHCQWLQLINLPSTLKRIGSRAFAICNRLEPIDLPEGLESLGEEVFTYSNNFRNARIPPNVSKIERRIFTSFDYSSGSDLVSVELSENAKEINGAAFAVNSIRNVAYPANAIVSEVSYDGQSDLNQVFKTPEEKIEALKHRFDGLPIHKLCYYQSYYEAHDVYKQLKAAIMLGAGKKRSLGSNIDPTGDQQDCLGMTPLHILACSTVPHRGLYELIIEHYPGNLIAQDKWGAMPALYAFWTGAPSIDILLESHDTHFPDTPLDWGLMKKTLSKQAPATALKDLQDTYRALPQKKQPIEWESFLYEMAEYVGWGEDENFRSLVTSAVSDCLASICVEQWRAEITSIIGSMWCEEGGRNFQKKVKSIFAKLALFESIMEGASLIELGLSKTKLTNSQPEQKSSADEASFRIQCRLSCGSDTVIENVLPYLLPGPDDAVDDESSASEEESHDY